MKRPAKLLGICLHFLFEFNKTSFVHSPTIKSHKLAFTSKLLCFPTVLRLVPFIALNVFACFPLMTALLSKRKNLFLINSAQLTAFLNL